MLRTRKADHGGPVVYLDLEVKLIEWITDCYQQGDEVSIAEVHVK